MEPVKEAVARDIDPRPPLEVSLKERLAKTLRWEAYDPFMLSRVPHIMRESHKDLYEPRVVSIGPYHHGKQSLSAMEAHKPRCLIDFLDRNPKVGLEVFVEKIRELEERARRCYSETINLNKDEFVEMLLLDGCFLLDFFFKACTQESHALLDVGWGTETIIGDLLLFENQIPFFVVEIIYSTITCYEGDRDSLLFLLQPSWMAPDLRANWKIYNLLHLYYQWFIPGRISLKSRPRGSNSSSSNSRTIISWQVSKNWPNERCYTPMRSMPCATDLYEAGVTFRKKEFPADMFDITFQNGVMEIPTIQIDSFWKVLYQNLAAFEHSCSMIENDMRSYVALMASLINTKKDVVLLKRCGIINNMLLHEDELMIFFNQLGDWSIIKSNNHYFASLFSDVQLYDSRWHKYRARLLLDYFNNPWSGLSVIAAIVLLVLTAIQAIFAMYPVIH